MCSKAACPARCSTDKTVYRRRDRGGARRHAAGARVSLATRHRGAGARRGDREPDAAARTADVGDVCTAGNVGGTRGIVVRREVASQPRGAGADDRRRRRTLAARVRVQSAAARQRGSHAGGQFAVRRGHRAFARYADLARAFVRARHAAPRRAAQERRAILDRLHRVHRRSRHHQDRESRCIEACSAVRRTSCVDEPIAKFITLLAGDGSGRAPRAHCTA